MASSAPSAASCSMDVVSSSGSESGPPTAFLARPSGNVITLAYWQGKGEAARVEVPTKKLAKAESRITAVRVVAEKSVSRPPSVLRTHARTERGLADPCRARVASFSQSDKKAEAVNSNTSHGPFSRIVR